MIKRVSLVRRRAGMSHEDFIAHWSGPHVEIVRQLPGVRGLRLNVIDQQASASAGWDGVGEVWFDSIEAAEAAFAHEPLASQLRDDRAKFLGAVEVVFVRERTIVAPPQS